MSLNKRRFWDKWIIPKNNKNIERHRMYVAFVINFNNMHSRFPSVEDYLENIVDFLVWTKANKKGKKTAKDHQLFQPVFFNMLKVVDNIVYPTKLGIALLLDMNQLHWNSIIFHLFDSATFSSGVTGSSPLYDEIYPIHELLENLVKYKKISFGDLNEKFYGNIPGIDVKTKAAVHGKEPKWEYVVSMMKDANIIKVHGSEHASLSVKSKSYNKKNFIFLDRSLPEIIPEKKLLAMYSIKPEFKISDVIKKAMLINDKKGSGIRRDPVLQTAWKELLFERDKGCVICDISYKPLTVASHIKDYSKCTQIEQYDINNGITLCNNHDALFDKKLFSINSNGKILFSEGLAKEKNLIFTERAKIKFEMNDTMQKYMQWHKERLKK